MDLMNEQVPRKTHFWNWISKVEIPHGFEPKTCILKGRGMNHTRASLPCSEWTDFFHSVPAVLLTLHFLYRPVFPFGLCHSLALALLHWVMFCDGRMAMHTNTCICSREESQSYSMPQCWPSPLPSPTLHDGYVFVTYIFLSLSFSHCIRIRTGRQ